jgi:hypothetical protein
MSNLVMRKVLSLQDGIAGCSGWRWVRKALDEPCMKPALTSDIAFVDLHH